MSEGNLMKSLKSLEPFFKPKSIAVVGASPKPGTVGRAITENLLNSFKGKLFLVNIKYDVIFGKKCYRSCDELPESPDLVVIAVPAKVVPEVTQSCGRKGCKAAVVISAGFREVGGEGIKLEEKLIQIAKNYGIRIIGPNCLGIYDPLDGLDTIFNPSDRQGKPKAGSAAFISQSGALGAAVLDWFAEADVGMSKFVSYGNAADVKEWELIEFLAEDAATKVIIAYVEGVEDGRMFISSIKKAVNRGKPVIVLKAGKSERGIKAVASHTGSLAGSYRIYESAIKQAGGLIVNELSEVITAVKALTWLPEPQGDRIAIVTNGGGAGVLATDAIELNKMRMAELSPETKKALRSELPSAASVNNPVDVLGDAPPDRYAVALEHVLGDDGVDAVVLIGIMQSPAFDPGGVLKAAKEALRKFRKPLVMAAPGGRYTSQKIKSFEREARIPSFRTPEEAVKALTYLVRWRRIKERLQIDH